MQAGEDKRAARGRDSWNRRRRRRPGRNRSMRSRGLWGGRARPGRRRHRPRRGSRRMLGRRWSVRGGPGWYRRSHGPRRRRNRRADPRGSRGGARGRGSHHGPRGRHVWSRSRRRMRRYGGRRRRRGRLPHCYRRCRGKRCPAVATKLAFGWQRLAAVGANNLLNRLRGRFLRTRRPPSWLHRIPAASAYSRGSGIGCPAGRTPNVSDGSLFGIFVGHSACLSSFEKSSDSHRLVSRTQIGLV